MPLRVMSKPPDNKVLVIFSRHIWTVALFLKKSNKRHICVWLIHTLLSVTDMFMSSTTKLNIYQRKQQHRHAYMDNFCEQIQTAVLKHKETLTNNDQRSTFAPIERIILRDYIPATNVITNPFAMDTSNTEKHNNRKRKKRKGGV